MYHILDSDSDMTDSPARDPFYVVKDKVQVLVQQLMVDFDRWKELFETTNTSNNDEFQKCSHSIKVTLKKLKVDLKDLTQTIHIVDSNRERFKNIDDYELDQRKIFVNNTKATCQNIHEVLTSERTKKKIASDKKRKTTSSDRSSFQREMARDADGFINDRRQEQQVLVERQDVVLDDMSAALERLGDIAGVINTEFTQQDALLDEIDTEMDEAEDRMQIVMKKIEKLLGTSDRWKLCCIFFLFLLMILLFFLVIYT